MPVTMEDAEVEGQQRHDEAQETQPHPERLPEKETGQDVHSQTSGLQSPKVLQVTAHLRQCREPFRPDAVHPVPPGARDHQP